MDDQSEYPNKMDKHEPLLQKRTPVIFWMSCILSLLAIGIAGFSLYWNQRPAEIALQNQTALAVLQPFTQSLEKLEAAQQALTTTVTNNHLQLQHFLREQRFQENDWEIQKVRYYLSLAQINAEWTHDAQTTLALLKNANVLLDKINDPQFQNLRQAIAEDLAHFQALPATETVQTLTKLKTLEKQIMNLSRNPLLNAAPSAPSQNPPSTWKEHLQSSLEELRGLIVIHHEDEPFIKTIDPAYLEFLREMMRLNLQQAEIAVFTKQNQMFMVAIQSALDIVCQSFNPQDPATQTIIQGLNDLKKTTFPTFPVLNAYSRLLDAAVKDEHLS